MSVWDEKNRSWVRQVVDQDPVGSRLTDEAKDRAVDFAMDSKGPVGITAEMGIRHVTADVIAPPRVHDPYPEITRSRMEKTLDDDPVGRTLAGEARQRAIAFASSFSNGTTTAEAVSAGIRHVRSDIFKR